MTKLVLVLALVAVFAVAALAIQLPENDYETLFSAYIKKHNKYYSREEFMSRFHIFKQNYQKILIHNNKPESERSGVVLGAGPLADLTTAEYRRLLGFRLNTRVKASKRFAMSEGDVNVDGAVDWRDQGAVNDVQNQGNCGSCWAFSAVAATECAVKVAGHRLSKLSEQQLVDCTRGAPYDCEGCNGCLMHSAFQYMIDNKGLCSGQEYPYKGTDNQCKKISTSCSRVPIVSYTNVTCADPQVCPKAYYKPVNETAQLDAVRDIGVLSIALEADTMVFQYYQGGVLDNPGCGKSLDHGVAIVGYGSENGKPYWIVRNSWSAQWGEEGYIRIVRGKNMCGLGEYSNLPVAAQ